LSRIASRAQYRHPASLLVLLLVFLAGCSTAPLPLSDQESLDMARLALPDTYPTGTSRRPRMEQVLKSLGFHWNNPRFTLGHHLIRENEIAWFDRQGTLHITRYTGIFRQDGYRSRRYVPSQSGDLEHRGSHVRPGLFSCLYDRPAEAIHYHRSLSSMALLAETAAGGAIDTMILPVSLPLCLFSDRRPDKFLRTETETDHAVLSRALRRYSRLSGAQNGNPIPTNVTAPAWVE